MMHLEINSIEDTKNSFMYTGQQFDAETGLYYLRARYMNTSNGRFLSRDLYSGNEFEPQTLHKYAYVSNNHVNNYDPLGLWMQKVIQGILEHRFINTQYIIEHPKHTVNYDRKNGYISGVLGRGYVDIIDYTSHEIYEIKPYKGKANGVAQVELYLRIINGYEQRGEFFDREPFRLGDSWPIGIRMSSWPLGGVISYWLEQNGLIEYYVQREDGEQYDNAYSWSMLKWKEFDVGAVTQFEVVILLAASLPNIIRLVYQARMVSLAF
ncbi:MAG: RHS repeat-associated core domain-containing protein [Lachnospiraceae bacterium]|nr:RHS repeat-associated core domain-containing protein [Lachnospiraceae bacterium]